MSPDDCLVGPRVRFLPLGGRCLSGRRAWLTRQGDSVVPRDGAGSAYGIYNGASARVIVTGNQLIGSGAGSTALRCDNGNETISDNVTNGFGSASTCPDDGGNIVKP